MKVALACDHLLEKNYESSVLESLVMLFPHCEVFTLAHRIGAVPGPIEQRKIHSSFLSNFVKDEKTFWKWTLVAPGAANNLFIPCSFDLIICLGSGFSSMISHCKTTPKITYLLSDSKWWPEKKGFRDKIFRSFVKSSVEKAIHNSRIIVTASENLFEQKSDAPKEVIFPPVKIDRFPLFGEEQRKLFKADFWIVDENSFEELEFNEFEENMKKNNINFRLLKNHNESSKLKGEFISDDSLAPVLANSKGMIVGSKKLFSDLAIKALACGRPILVSARSGFKSFISSGEGIGTYSNFSELNGFMEKFGAENYTPSKVRGRAMKFNDVKFKVAWKKFAENHANQEIEA